MLTFGRKQNTEEICKILVSLIEPLQNRSTLITQCEGTQIDGHTKYCSRQESCVKCVKKYLTRISVKKRNEMSKCTNCGEKPFLLATEDFLLLRLEMVNQVNKNEYQKLICSQSSYTRGRLLEMIEKMHIETNYIK